GAGGMKLLAGRALPSPKARESPYVPPATPASTATTSATVWTRCSNRRCRFRPSTCSTISAGSGRSINRSRPSLILRSNSGIVRHPLRHIFDPQGRAEDLPRPVQRGLDRPFAHAEGSARLCHGHPQVVVENGRLALDLGEPGQRPHDIHAVIAHPGALRRIALPPERSSSPALRAHPSKPG